MACALPATSLACRLRTNADTNRDSKSSVAFGHRRAESSPPPSVLEAQKIRNSMALPRLHSAGFTDRCPNSISCVWSASPDQSRGSHVLAWGHQHYFASLLIPPTKPFPLTQSRFNILSLDHLLRRPPKPSHLSSFSASHILFHSHRTFPAPPK